MRVEVAIGRPRRERECAKQPAQVPATRKRDHVAVFYCRHDDGVSERYEPQESSAEVNLIAVRVEPHEIRLEWSVMSR